VTAPFGGLLEEAARTLADDEAWDWFVRGLPEPVRRRMYEEWSWQAHGGQAEPRDAAEGGSDWRVWLMMAGRGFGKTLAGAHWVHARARETPGARIALVGGSADEVRKVMIEGPCGLLDVARAGEPMVWNATQGMLRFASGAEAFVYSARAPEKLRGPEHDFAWCDELAKWGTGRGPGHAQGEAAWDNLQMGMRRARGRG